MAVIMTCYLIKHKMSEEFLQSIIGSVESNEVVCADKFIGDSTLENLVTKLKISGQNKKFLVLRGNCLSSNAGSFIGYLLRENKQLEFLSLEWNQLGSGLLTLF